MTRGALLVGLSLALACALPLGSPTRAADSQTLEARIIEVAERVKPAVVHIEAIVRVNDRRYPVSGSGVIVHSAPHGYCLARRVAPTHSRDAERAPFATITRSNGPCRRSAPSR